VGYPAKGLTVSQPLERWRLSSETTPVRERSPPGSEEKHAGSERSPPVRERCGQVRLPDHRIQTAPRRIR
jgi:hypothetical protein